MGMVGDPTFAFTCQIECIQFPWTDSIDKKKKGVKETTLLSGCEGLHSVSQFSTEQSLIKYDYYRIIVIIIFCPSKNNPIISNDTV